MSDRKEAERLWALIVQCEKSMVATNLQDFAAKQKEMQSLRAAYARATGTSCNPNNYRENERKGDLKAFEGIGGRPGDNLTSEDLNNVPRQYRPDERRG